MAKKEEKKKHVLNERLNREKSIRINIRISPNQKFLISLLMASERYGATVASTISKALIAEGKTKKLVTMDEEYYYR